MSRYAFMSMLLSAGLGLAADARAAGAAYPAMAPVGQYRIASREDEIALARSAAPPSISDEAEVLVLGERGYESAIHGSNGFVCFVERSWAAGFDEPEFWNPKLRSPNCFNPPAARTELPRYLERTRWVLAGATLAQLVARTRAAVAGHRYRVPEPGAMSFMLSKRGYVSDESAGPWLPHLMFFLPPGQAVNWGAGREDSPVLGKDGGRIETTILFIPVRRWSDGTPGPPAAALHVM